MAIVRSNGTRAAGITEGQQQAIQEAMAIILEEDTERGIGLETFPCSACGVSASAAGAIQYETEMRLCHACATRFELAHLGGQVRTCAEYVANVRTGRHLTS